MPLNIDITPEIETRLQQEAERLGQEPVTFALGALQQALGMTTGQDGTDSAILAEWRGASNRTLQEYWDNDEDAVYDTLGVSPASAPPELGAGGRSSLLKRL